MDILRPFRLSTAILAISVLSFACSIAAAPGQQAATVSPKAGDSDPADRQALQEVCARCHNLGMFAGTIRSQSDWAETIQAMIERGATGTDEQFGRVYNYLAQTQSSIDVNRAPAEEIGPVLDVSDAVADMIVARRATRKFADLADLKTIPGVDPETLDARRARLAF